MPLVEYAEPAGAVLLTWALQAPVAGVRQHLADPDRLPEWLGRRTAGGFEAGQTLVVDHGDGHLCTSRVERASGEEIAMTWEFPDEPRSQLSVRLEGVPMQGTESTLLHLTHLRLGDLAASYLPGWITHLTYLEASVLGEPLARDAFWRLYETFQRLGAH